MTELPPSKPETSKLSADDRKAEREKVKQIAEQRRADRKNRKRKCALCGTEESDKSPFVAHPDGLGPTCKEPSMCENYRSVPRVR